MSGRTETYTMAQRDVRLLIDALDDLRVWFGPGFDLAGFGAEESGELVHRLVFSLPNYRSPAAKEAVDLVVGDDPALNGNGVAAPAADPLKVHLSRREWQLLKRSLETFLGIDGISQDWYPEILESMVHLHERLSETP